jgi:hypothetical protein
MYFLQRFIIKLNLNLHLLCRKSCMIIQKSVLERVSFDPLLFCKELEKAIKMLLLL